jgi:Tol biopolymer transport system component
MSANGKDIHQFLPAWKGSPYTCCGNWSPDGNYYFFEAGQGSDQSIWTLPEHGPFLSGVQPLPSQLIAGPLRFSSPVPSGDGKRLFVVGEEPRTELLRYDSRTHRFDSYLQGVSAGPFDFSADHKWITYVSYPDMNLWKSRADGSDRVELTFPPVRAYGPSWSPNNSKIAFMDVRFGRPWKISLVSSSGGASQSIPTISEDEVQADPGWMRDGKSVVFARSKRTDMDRMEICILDLDKGKATLLPDSDGLNSPRVSPDGRYIAAFTSSRAEMVLFDSRTQRWSSLLKENLLAFNFWSHDGKYVYFRESSASGARLARVRIADRAVEPVMSLKGFPQVSDVYTGWIGLTPDDAPVLIRDRSLQEIYALDLR